MMYTEKGHSFFATRNRLTPLRRSYSLGNDVNGTTGRWSILGAKGVAKFYDPSERFTC